MSKWNLLSLAYTRDKSASSSNAATKNSAEMIRLRMMQRLEPSAVTRFSETRYPDYLFFVAERDSWMRSAKTYESDNAAGRVHMVDEDRIDALVSRDYFRKEYEDGVARLTTRTACALRTFSSWFGFRDEVVEGTTYDRNGVRRASVNSVEEEMKELTQYVLIAVHTQTLHNALLWDVENNNMPTLMRVLKKNIDVCLEYPLRYDVKRLRVALPSKQSLQADYDRFQNELSKRY